MGTINMDELNSTDMKIITATFDLLQKEGLTKTTTKKIAAEAGVNEVTIFRNFKNKQNLVNITKEYYLDKCLKTVQYIFKYEEDEEIDEYLRNSFLKLSNLSENDYNIIKVGLREIGNLTEKKQMLSKITSEIIKQMDEYFKIQIEKGKIRSVDSKALTIMCFSTLFQSYMLGQLYTPNTNNINTKYGENFLDILYNGISV